MPFANSVRASVGCGTHSKQMCCSPPHVAVRNLLLPGYSSMERRNPSSLNWPEILICSHETLLLRYEPFSFFIGEALNQLPPPLCTLAVAYSTSKGNPSYQEFCWFLTLGVFFCSHCSFPLIPDGGNFSFLPPSTRRAYLLGHQHPSAFHCCPCRRSRHSAVTDTTT